MAKSFPFSIKYKDAMRELVDHPDCDEHTVHLITGIVSNTERSGYVSQRQAWRSGVEYKRVVNHGKFIRHDWWY